MPAVVLVRDHIIVHATDPRRSAALLAGVLGAAVLHPDRGRFVRVSTGTRVTVDYLLGDPPFAQLHCAFLVDDTTFDTAHRRLLDDRIMFYADAWRSQPGEVNNHRGLRGVYFDDPDGHLVELMTVRYGDTALVAN